MNLRADPAPARRSVPGTGGTIPAPNTFAVRPPVPTTAEDWKAADDARILALAPPGERQRLDKEAQRLAASEAAAKQAEAVAEAAKRALIECRVSGRESAKAERVLDAASARAAKATRDAGIAAEVVTLLRSRIIAAVRAEMAGKAHAKLTAAQRRYDDALAILAGAPAAIAELQAARRAEIAAAAELATGSGETPGFRNGQRADAATGSRHLTMSAEVDLLAIYIDQTPDKIRLEGGHVAAYLARRPVAAAEERPALLPDR